MSRTLPAVRNSHHQFSRGEVIAGRYLLDDRIGVGASGEVFSALDIAHNYTRVAVKFLRREADSCEGRERFDNERRALELLHPHPNIVELIDQGEAEGLPFLVMERLDLSLEKWLEELRQQDEQPAFPQVYRLFLQICDALAAAHRLRVPGPITHRDINPRNVMLRRLEDGSLIAKVLDFGVARLGVRRFTNTGELIGTPGYLPPEQAHGYPQSSCPASDVFSLGVLLVELLVQHTRGPHDTSLDHAAEQYPHELPAFLHTLRSDVPDALWDVIARCLQPQVAARYKDAGVLRQAVTHAVESPREHLSPATLQLPSLFPLDLDLERTIADSCPLFASSDENEPTQRRPKIDRIDRLWLFTGLHAGLRWLWQRLFGPKLTERVTLRKLPIRHEVDTLPL